MWHDICKHFIFLTGLLFSKMFSRWYTFVLSEALRCGLCGNFFVCSCVLAEFECACGHHAKTLVWYMHPQHCSSHGSGQKQALFFLSCVLCLAAARNSYLWHLHYIISASHFLITFTQAPGHHGVLQSPLFSATSCFLITLPVSQSRSPAFLCSIFFPFRQGISNHRDSPLPLHHEWLIYLIWLQALFKHRVAQCNLQLCCPVA